MAAEAAVEETAVGMDIAETEDTAADKKVRQYLEVTQEMLDETAKRLGVMLDFLCLDASVRSEKRNSRIHLIVTSSDAGRIIGRKGQSLESLQLLLNRMMQKDDVNYPKINIDIDGYPAKDGAEGKPRRAPKGEREDRPQRKDRKDPGIRIVPLHQSIDPHNSYLYAWPKVHARSKARLRIDNNALHASLEGGAQMADAICGWLLKQLEK